MKSYLDSSLRLNPVRNFSILPFVAFVVESVELSARSDFVNIYYKLS
jgi:hypothetical protein